MPLHLGHHFYGAGNLGDDFMLAGFLSGLRQQAAGMACTCSVPFDLAPLRGRFPEIEWLPYDPAARAQAIARCEAWLGLGGSPFQSAQSRWFIDHLLDEARLCAESGKRMYFLGVGVQTTAELAVPEVAQLCRQAAAIWTRDAISAARLRTLLPAGKVEAAADLAHLFFRATPPPPAGGGRVTLVANFDYAGWPGQAACLRAIATLRAKEHVWLAQESRELPGAERALHAALPPEDRARWQLVCPDAMEPVGAPLPRVLARWPSGEWLVTARYHAALAGAWAGSKVIIIGINEKLRGAAAELDVPLIAPDADDATVGRALAAARPVPPVRLQALAESTANAVASFVRSAVAPGA
ncbi:MAG TPA: hypothetical protein VGE76_05710 [Opitutaceae bacterium]